MTAAHLPAESGTAPDIAIVGMASHFPDAPGLHDFWSNILAGKDSISDIGSVDGDEYWRKQDFYDPDPNAPDKTYGFKAGFVPPIDFDPVEFKIPPLMLESISTTQLFALYVAKQAMLDANLIGARAGAVDSDRIGVILGGAGNGNTSFSLAARQQAPYLRTIMMNSGLSAQVADGIIERVKSLYLEWNEDSFPGFLGNVACGRIASYFDLGGTSYMVDAACASSLAAIKAAIGELADGSCDAVLTGGVNLENSIFSFLCFSKTPALSKSNLSRPFDEDADGMMLGDGVGLLVLKRLQDAERHGDRIYAVIKSLAASSDGRAKSIFAPRYEGQVKALRRAYQRAAVSPADIQLIEAHGTGTQSGDNTELKSLQGVFDGLGIPERSIAVGSIKSQIGHTRCAAGAAAMMKVALGLHHKVLPPTINVTKPTASLGSPFYVNTESRPWVRPVSGKPRRAALSAFGFGGTNYHAILEEYGAEPRGRYRLNRQAEICVFHAPTPAQLIEECESRARDFAGEHGNFRFRSFAKEGPPRRIEPGEARLAFVASCAAQAASLLTEAIKQLKAQPGEQWEHPLGIYCKPHAQSPAGKVVALFPGQGSQYVGMARATAADYPEMRRAIEGFDAAALAAGLPDLSGSVYPPPAFSETLASQQMHRLTETSRAQPAIGAVSAGYFRLLQSMGFKPDFAAGHSYGEVTALWATGVLSDENFRKVSLARGLALQASADADAGAMLAASLQEDTASEVLSRFEDLAVANYNSSEQLVFGGSTAAIQQAYQFLSERKIRCQILPVSAAFHTPYVRHAVARFSASIADVPFSAAHGALFSSAAGARHSDEPDEIRRSLCAQLLQPVRFRQTIERIHAEGGRLFVEIGPKGVLGKLVGEILKGEPHSVVSLNPSASGDDAVQFRKAIAKLIVEGVELGSPDSWAVAEPAAEPKKAALTYPMQGGFFLSQKSKEKRRQALRTDTREVDAFLSERAPRKDVNRSMNAAKGDVIMQYGSNGQDGILSALDAQTGAQNALSQVHQQFQLNQKDYVQLLNSLMAKQCSLLERYHGSQQLPDVVSSLSQSLQLLDKNQELYHVNHERYFDSQQSLMLNAEVRGGGRTVARIASVTAATPALRHERAAGDAAPLGLAVAAQAPTKAAPPLERNQPAPPTAARQFDVVVAPKPSLPQVSSLTPSAAVASVPVPKERAQPLSAENQALIERFEAMTEDDLVAQLIAIVSERTGYPSDMITAEMDLEADLGVDSIKRLEIFGAMFDRLATGVAYFQDTETLKDTETFDVEAFSNIRKMAGFFLKTIAELLAEVKGSGAAQQIDAVPPAVERLTVQTTQADEAPPVAERSGAHMAGAGNAPQLVEQTGARTENASVSPARALGFVASTRKLGDAGRKEPAPGASKPPATSQAQAAPAPQPAIDDLAPPAETIRRYEACRKIEPRPDQAALELAPGRIWLLTDDGKGLSDEVAKLLLAEGQKVVRLAVASQPGKASRKSIKGVPDYALSRCDEQSIQEVIARIEKAQGEIGGFIHHQPPADRIKSPDAAFPANEYDTVLTVFTLAKLLQPRLGAGAAGRAYFFVISQIDGELGIARRGCYSVVGAGMSGLTKSLGREWEGVHSRTVDIDPRATKSLAASWILEELKDPRLEPAEVGRGGQGERVSLGFHAATGGDAPPREIDGQSLFLVTGGARGITAECIVSLAQRHPARFALLGRTDIDAPLPAWADGAADTSALKANAIKHLQAQGEQPTPVKIERMLKGVLHVVEIKETIQRIQSASAKVVYLACDITDERDVSRAVAQAEQMLGPVTGVIHGAGNLADKLIEKKTEADFRLVFHTKVKGLENVLKALKPQSLRHLVLFSSVSGFFGNAGQTDYSMANETLNKFAHLFQSCYPDCFVRAINWGPWDAGMVSDSLKKAYQERNLAIVPKAVGTRLFVEELRCGSAAAQVIIGGGSYKVPLRRARILKDSYGPIVRHVKPQDNPFLADHVIDGHATLPTTAAAGWMVKLGEDALPGYRFESLRDFKVLKGIVFNEPESTIFKAHLKPLEAAGKSRERHAAEVSLCSESDGEILNRYRAVVTLSRESGSRPLYEAADLSATSTVTQPIYGDMREGALLFHGPAFRGIRSVLNVDDKRLTLACRLDAVDDAAQGQYRVNSFNPYLGDVCIQAPLVWLMLKTDKAGLPSHIGRIEQFAPLDFAEPFYLSMQIGAHSHATLAVDIAAHDAAGNIYSRFSDVQFTVSGRMRQLFCGPDAATAAA